VRHEACSLHRPRCRSRALLLGALAAPASAHNIRLSPKVGDARLDVRLQGQEMAARGTVFVDYYESGAAQQSVQVVHDHPRGERQVHLPFIRPVNSLSIGLTPKMCFNQRDTRFARSAGFSGPGRLFTPLQAVLRRAADGALLAVGRPPGDAFLLMTNGWYPNQRVVLDLTRPDGLTETYTDLAPARRRARSSSSAIRSATSSSARAKTYRLFRAIRAC
jgi:hypothetical protein